MLNTTFSSIDRTSLIIQVARAVSIIGQVHSVSDSGVG